MKERLFILYITEGLALLFPLDLAWLSAYFTLIRSSCIRCCNSFSSVYHSM